MTDNPTTDNRGGTGAVRRDYRGRVDLPALIRFGQRIWTADARWHIGDLAWDIGLAPDNHERWSIALWERDAEIVGAGWLTRPNRLSVILGAGEAGLLDDIIAWAHRVHAPTDAGDPITITVLDTENWLVGPLIARGYEAELDSTHFVAMHRSLIASADMAVDLPAVPPLPSGFSARPVRDTDELPARFALHRAVWTASETTDDVLSAMTRRWPYRMEFDWVVQAPDGALVSYILGWYDDVNRVGEFEPVGTRAEFRRMGLSRALGIALMRAFRAAGAERALVYARGDDGYPIPRQVYGSLGFRPHGRTVVYHPKQG